MTKHRTFTVLVESHRYVHPRVFLCSNEQEAHRIARHESEDTQAYWVGLWPTIEPDLITVIKKPSPISGDVNKE